MQIRRIKASRTGRQGSALVYAFKACASLANGPGTTQDGHDEKALAIYWHQGARRSTCRPTTGGGHWACRNTGIRQLLHIGILENMTAKRAGPTQWACDQTSTMLYKPYEQSAKNN